MTVIAQYQCQATELALQFRKKICQPHISELADMLQQLPEYLSAQDSVHQAEFSNIVQAFVECQQQDWLGLADYLEYELQDLLHLCSQSVFVQLP